MTKARQAGPLRGAARYAASRRGVLAATASALVLTAAWAGAASGDNGLPDTQVTPIARQSDTWQHVAGVDFMTHQLVKNSETPADVDFYKVAFRNTSNGFAVGARCQQPESDLGKLDGCARVPTIYQYTNRAGEGPRWRRATLPGDDSPGYVGAVAWIGPERALAVGGTGSFPRREPDFAASGQQAGQAYGSANDQVGAPRAWLYESGAWHELDLAHERAQGMRGLSALDCLQDGTNFCVAGALGQLWHWQDPGFTTKYDASSDPAAMDNAAKFLFRVREVRFVRNAVDPAEVDAFAVTDGCCAETVAANASRLLSFVGRVANGGVVGKWSVRPLGSGAVDVRQASLDSAYAFEYAPKDLKANPVRTNGAMGVVLSAGGRESSQEGHSIITGSWAVEPGPADSPLIPLIGSSVTGSSQSKLHSVSSFRLVAGDGDITGGSPSGPNGVPDWVVGEDRATGQGLAVDSSPPSQRNGIDFGQTPPTVDSNQTIEWQRSHGYVLLPTYRLNSIDVIDPTGIAWAVGDRGAIAKLGDPQRSGAAGTEPDPPPLGSREPGRLPPDDPYTGYRLAGPAPQTGTVPGLDSGPVDRLTRPVFEPYGSPDATQTSGSAGESVRSIVTSADGSEAWAVGPDTEPQASTWEPPTLYHLRGTAWTRCDMLGVPGQAPPDAACADLAPLRRLGLELQAAARVPGADDGAGGKFEVVAVGRLRHAPPDDQSFSGVIVRYSNGRWAPESAAATHEIASSYIEITSVAFDAPDDGWALARKTAAGSWSLLHFNGKKWLDCSLSQNNEACGNPSGRLPLGPGVYIPPVRGGLWAAGDRVFLAGTRAPGSTGANSTVTYPLVLSHGRGGTWTDENGLDPGFSTGAPPSAQGHIGGFTIARRSDGHYDGWATGQFGAVLRGGWLRLSSGDGWRPWTSPSPQDAGADYPTLFDVNNITAFGKPLFASVPGDGPSAAAYVTVPYGPILGYDHTARRWRVVPAPFEGSDLLDATDGKVQAIAPDGRGGVWVAAGPPGGSPFFYRLTTEPRHHVLRDVPEALHASYTALAGTAGGTVWAAMGSGHLARYDRLTGWGVVQVPGWDPGSVVTRPSAITAVAVGSDGQGLAVGERGRIADLGSGLAKLDAAAGQRCDPGGPAPCGTGRTLRGVAVAPDGSAMTVGDALALLWRPSGGEFRAVTKPVAPLSATITGVAMPSADEAWITTDTGEVFAGHREGEDWTWQSEAIAANGDPLSFDSNRNAIPLRAVAIDGGGHGFAVGDRGVVLERQGGGPHPWKRVTTGLLDDLTSVALPAGGGEGALVGGRNGLVLTHAGGQFDVVEPANPYSTDNGTVTGLALLPGDKPAQVEAWVAQDLGQRGGALLHYTNDSSDPLLDPGARVQPLPDSPTPRPNEIVFAAFGKSDCSNGEGDLCPDPSGTNRLDELVSRRIVQTLADATRKPGGPRFSVFSGDATDHGGQLTSLASTNPAGVDTVPHPSGLDRWRELVADPLNSAGIPLLTGLGTRDLTQQYQRSTGFVGSFSTNQVGRIGSNLFWRRAMTGMPGQDGGTKEFGRLSYRLVADGSRPTPDTTIPDAGTGPTTVPAGGARTHFALDVCEGGCGRGAVVRLVFVDSSLRSLGGGDPVQQPLEPTGGQQAWLDRVLCVRGRPGNANPCTRSADEKAVVVSTTPSYSYGPGIGTDTALDSATFESLVLKNQATAVVSGRIGWNGLYWTMAAGVHCPGPGGTYQPDPPAGAASCVASGAGVASTPSQVQQVADAVQGLAAPAPPPVGTGSGVGDGRPVPFVVASGAGGKLADTGADRGFWHGYTLVRLAPSGDPAGTIVEQRPSFDWVTVNGSTHVLSPGQRMTLRGVGREPLGVDVAGAFDRIDSPAITHRYDLVLADPDKPYLPQVDPSSDTPNHYVPVPPDIGASVDSQTGAVTYTGNGNHPPVYAIAMLSVGDRVATWPLVLMPRRSFTVPLVKQHRIVLPPPPRVLASVPAQIPPTPATPIPKPPQLNLTFPQAPSLPNLSLGAPQAQAPAPPAPPPPPASPAATALQISAAPVGLNLAPQATVIPPPAPPVQPAPPSGARREARQRQAAVAKSEQGAQPEATEESSLGPVDLANDAPMPPGAAMTRRDEGRPGPSGAAVTRRDRVRPAPSFTPFAARHQPSAWTRDALTGGGLVLAAFVLTAGWTLLRPRPRPHARPHAAVARASLRAPWRP